MDVILGPILLPATHHDSLTYLSLKKHITCQPNVTVKATIHSK